MLGRIKFLDRENRGFGFIIADDGTEYFYHIKDVVNGQPIKGQKCEFVTEHGDRGPVAKAIRLDRPMGDRGSGGGVPQDRGALWRVSGVAVRFSRCPPRGMLVAKKSSSLGGRHDQSCD
jgi:cold shock CspA family protein